MLFYHSLCIDKPDDNRDVLILYNLSGNRKWAIGHWDKDMSLWRIYLNGQLIISKDGKIVEAWTELPAI